MRSNCIRVVARERLLRAFIRILHHIRKRLNSIPRRIRRKLQCEPMIGHGLRSVCLIDQLIETELLGLSSANRHRHCFRHQHAITEYRYRVFFSVAEISCRCYYLILYSTISLRNFKIPCERCTLTFLCSEISFAITRISH